MTPVEIIEASEKVVLHVCFSDVLFIFVFFDSITHSSQLKSTATSLTNVAYDNELILIITVVESEDGTLKISYAKEFIDSKYTESFFTAERERAQVKE